MSFDADKGMIDMSELDKKTAEIKEAAAVLDAGAGDMKSRFQGFFLFFE